MNEWTNEWMNEWMNERMNEWTNEWNLVSEMNIDLYNCNSTKCSTVHNGGKAR